MQVDTEAVRRYLLYLRDPSTLIDDKEVEAAKKALAAAKTSDDPIVELEAYAELERSLTADPTHVEQAFQATAKTYTDHHEIPVQAWRAMGVPEDMLRRAGLLGGTKAQTATKAAAKRSRVSRDEVIEAVRSRKSTFHIADVVEATGASTATVRSVIGDLVDQGVVRDEGDDPAHDGRGRAPKVYRVA